MSRAARILGVLFGTALVAGCSSGPLTELFIVVDSNLSMPSEIDRLEIVVLAGGEMQTSGGPLVSAATTPFPRTVDLVHRGGPLGPVEIHAAVLRGGTEVVTRDVRTSFVEGQTRVLRIALDRECIGVTCTAGMTCAGAACRSADVPTSELLVYPDGTGPRMDDGGMCVPFDERCNGMDEDCDGRIDEGIDLSTDVANCGACMNPCVGANHATPTCTGGTCGVTCEGGFGDCDTMAANGCEADLTTAAACGSCDNPCDIPNAAATCTASTCIFDSCLTGFDDCNDDTADGCEVDLGATPEHCGACDAACMLANAVEGCAGGMCTVASCDAGFGDCDTMAANGCEDMLRTLTSCGACGTACAPANATGNCTTGTCLVMSCNPGFDDCNSMDADGCEQALTTLTHCGTCGRTCALSNATETCATGTCQVVMCNTNFGNCDGMAANGCEADLRSNNSHCGMCGMACTLPDRCRMGICR